MLKEQTKSTYFIAETSDYLNTRVVSTGQTDQEHEAKIVNGSSLRVGNNRECKLDPVGFGSVHW